MNTSIPSRWAFSDKNTQMDHGKRCTCFEFFIEGTFSNVSSTNHDWDSVFPRAVDGEGNTSLVGLVLSFAAVLDVRRYFGVTVGDLHQDTVSVRDGIWTTISLEKLQNKKIQKLTWFSFVNKNLPGTLHKISEATCPGRFWTHISSTNWELKY